MTTREIAGKEIIFDEEGFMTNPDDWDKDVAVVLATDINIDLSDNHWAIIDFSRTDYASQGEAPGLRRISKEAGVTTKDIYKLFPKGPAKKIAYVSGLGKPTGCI